LISTVSRYSLLLLRHIVTRILTNSLTVDTYIKRSAYIINLSFRGLRHLISPNSRVQTWTLLLTYSSTLKIEWHCLKRFSVRTEVLVFAACLTISSVAAYTVVFLSLIISAIFILNKSRMIVCWLGCLEMCTRLINIQLCLLMESLVWLRNRVQLRKNLEDFTSKFAQ
jgi:hypothetical protein